jgi:hypothetical protein
MAWLKKTPNGDFIVATETYTLPASATTEYSTVVDWLFPSAKIANRYMYFGFNASAVTGTNLDIALYGAMTSGGTKVLLKDAVVADITATGLAIGQIDLNAYPYPYYYLAWTSDADESANTIDVSVIYKP